MRARPGSKTRERVWKFEGENRSRRNDDLATEEPMEIRLDVGGEVHTAAVTMRTPGDDFELAAGFLYSEGIIQSREQVGTIAYCLDPEVEFDQRYNIVTLELMTETAPDLRPLERHFFTTSACGVCGKASLEALELREVSKVPPGPEVSISVLQNLPAALRRAQGLFEDTGGLHAAGLFTPEGELVAVREDVGRHNAVDKLIGWALLEGRLPLHDALLMVSGRASFEILQKSLVAGVPFVCAVSAPSNLAVRLARQFGVTLVGFLRGERFNVYHGLERITNKAGEPVSQSRG